ncbi:MAG: hypothetical protein HGA35_02905, partial [Erysipelotrichaceae bacterium]|nr:hypothetical protein [Erysipelotrichaceae bacterium]
FLRNSATSLSLKLSPEEFKRELNNIKNKLQNPTSSAGGEVSTGTSGVTSSGVGYTIE